MIKNKSRQYLFKNKLKIRRKSRGELIKESFLMMIFALLLLLTNYFIPQKIELFNSFIGNIFGIFRNILEILSHSLEILIVLFVCSTFLMSIILIAGSLNRLVKVLLPRSRKIKLR